MNKKIGASISCKDEKETQKVEREPKALLSALASEKPMRTGLFVKRRSRGAGE